jgi:WD40 repeat protein
MCLDLLTILFMKKHEGRARPAAEGSAWSRQSARWQPFSETVQTALLPFVDTQRLLVRRANTTVEEVAHGALFRSWSRLRRWLEENAEALPLMGKVVRQPLATRELAGHADSVIDAVFSPRGDHIHTASLDNTVRVWQSDGRAVRKRRKSSPVVLRHPSAVNDASFSPGGERIVSGS